MGEVIYVDFKKSKNLEPKIPANSIMNYLLQCRSVLIEEDYRDLLAAIIDPAVYAVSDNDIQLLADGYFEQTIKK